MPFLNIKCKRFFKKSLFPGAILNTTLKLELVGLYISLAYECAYFTQYFYHIIRTSANTLMAINCSLIYKKHPWIKVIFFLVTFYSWFFLQHSSWYFVSVLERWAQLSGPLRISWGQNSAILKPPHSRIFVLICLHQRDHDNI